MISKEMDSILMKSLLRSSKIVDRGHFLENIKAGVAATCDDTEGYSEGTREAYEEFVKRRNYKIGEERGGE